MANREKALADALRDVMEHIYCQNDYTKRDYDKYYAAVEKAKAALALPAGSDAPSTSSTEARKKSALSSVNNAEGGSPRADRPLSPESLHQALTISDCRCTSERVLLDEINARITPAAPSAEPSDHYIEITQQIGSICERFFDVASCRPEKFNEFVRTLADREFAAVRASAPVVDLSDVEEVRKILCEVCDEYRVPISKQIQITKALWRAYAAVVASAQQEMRDMGFQHPDDVAKMVLEAAVRASAQNLAIRKLGGTK